MRAREYRVMEQAVECGIKLGWNRAHKLDPEPNDERIMDAILSAVMLEVTEWFLFEDQVESDPSTGAA